MGLAASGVVAAAASGAFVFLQPTTDRIYEAPAHAEESRSMNEEQLLLAPTNRAATSAVPVQAAPETDATDTSTPGLPSLSATMAVPTKAEISPSIAPSAPADPSPGPRLSELEIDALRRHGDAFLSAGDVTSARLYYERAAEAGDGDAALQLGASYDPVVLSFAGIHGVTGDPARALFWYRRALEFGMTGAEQRIKSLVEKADTLSR
jgi:TPR repeat protein